jgi:hypothetical protein
MITEAQERQSFVTFLHHLSAHKFALDFGCWGGGHTMLSEADERRAFERLERAWRIGDVEAQLIILQDLARYWWRLAELKRISDPINNSATESLAG